MRLKHKKNKYLLMLVVACTAGAIGFRYSEKLLSGSSKAQISNQFITASLSSEKRSIPPGLMCFNVNAIRVKQWDSVQFTDATKSLSPSVLRLPGGQGANYWDWQRGGLSQSFQGLPDGVPFFLKGARDRRYTAGSLENFYTFSKATDTTPLFVLNMLSSTLESQVSMLKQAESLGLPIEKIELGNEFYFGTRNNRAVFPSPVDYAKTSIQWIAKIKSEFPKARISVMGVSDSGRIRHRLEKRRLNWNRMVFPIVLDNADAVTLHVYPDHGLTPARTSASYDYPFFDEQDTPTILGEPFRHWNIIKKTDGFSTLPSDKKIWITEYNMHERLRQRKVRQTRVTGSWAHGLFNLVLGLLFLEDPRVEKICNHMLVGNSQFSAIYDGNKSFFNPSKPSIPTIPFDLSATGVALQPWGEILKKSNEARQVKFTNVPMLIGKQQFQYPALYGWSFANQQKKQEAVVVNLSKQPLEVDLSSIFPSGITYKQIEGHPRTLVTKTTSLQEVEGYASQLLSFPPYSVSHLKSRE
ncbi:hypothetical protein [Acaryochloris sp. IP29b_bin.148]|uniref:hypothetical protein n=1 Tax=Acaryochloris sp. IP29b_bin.148 TaxID=2969218 RepID=UPI0026395795|nr:hypothetical protein [Acaryochloris sp. IP29b_bin.148]